MKMVVWVYHRDHLLHLKLPSENANQVDDRIGTNSGTPTPPTQKGEGGTVVNCGCICFHSLPTFVVCAVDLLWCCETCYPGVSSWFLTVFIVFSPAFIRFCIPVYPGSHPIPVQFPTPACMLHACIKKI